MARIQTNVSALNAHRNLSMTNLSLAKSISKLSSGFRINRAADDAAGLAIANKLRSDVRSMQQAARNASQTNSLLQIADGALSTLSTMVDRMKELATQAASDNVTSAQRSTLDSEFQTLVSEFERIVQTTQYQGQSLLDGTFGTFYDAAAAGTTVDSNADVVTVNTNGTAADTYTVTETGTANELQITNAGATLTQVISGVLDGARTISFSAFNVSIQVGSGFTAHDGTNAGSFNANNAFVVAGANTADFLVSSTGSYATNDKISITNIDVTTATLSLDNDNLLNITAARSALTEIDSSIATIAGKIGEVGAAQNRVEFALANVNTSIENVAAAESTIRDADLAFEMVEFTKNQILQQAGTAMLAQANAAPQGILQLLAG